MTPSGELSSAPSRSISIPLPAGTPPAASQAPSGQRLGLLLLVLVSALGFLLASFPARNSDMWLHLARGRLLAHGQFPSTTDPDLAFDLWGNQTWLYDLFCYDCYTILAGAGLVAAKALLGVGIALLLLWRSRATGGWYLPAFCTSLALLTMSRYLALQPATVSYFFLALTIVALGFPRSAEDNASPPLLSWRLLLLFLVWANVDRWFLLGLGFVALVWVGEVVDVALSLGTSPKRWQGILLRRGFSLLALAGVCLANPSHIYAFVLAEELSGLGLSAVQVITPFGSGYFAIVGWNPASLAYYVLLALSMISFIATAPQWRWQRFLPWLVFALLSAFQMRAIPFFAVVAAPVLAWNIRDIIAKHFYGPGGEVQQVELLRFGQVLTAMLVLILLVCSWPGWLQSPPFGSRRWAFDLPPSLERVANTVRRWHEEGKLTADSGGLHLSADTVYAFAWFCPSEKRLRLTSEDSAADLRQRMHSEGIDHIFVYDKDRDRLLLHLSGLVLVADPEQWPLLDQEGDVAVFGWRDPARAGSDKLFRGWELELAQLAFHPPEEKKAPAEAFDAEKSERNWWEAFWVTAPPRSIDRDETLLNLLHAQLLADQRLAPLRHKSRWENTQAAGLIAAANTWASPVALCDAHLRLAFFGPQLPEEGSPAVQPAPLDRLVAAFQRRFTLQRDDAPPALYYLAVRAARRAVKADPEDARAYLMLGESYLGLLYATQERFWAAQLPQLMRLRQAQASAALNRALALRPDLPDAHFQLHQLYHKLGYLDLALKHLQTYLRLVREAGASRGEDYAKYQERAKQLAQELQQRESNVTIGAEDSPPRERAIQAFQRGLAGKALDVLLGSDISAFGNEGMDLELELLLGVGRANDVYKWLTPEYERALGPLEYHWFRVRALAAIGDYTRAEEECDEAARAIVRAPEGMEPVSLREKAAFWIAKHVMTGSLHEGASFGTLFSRIDREMLHKPIEDTIQLLRQQADLSVLHGLLALEEGEIGEAESAFRAALALRKDQNVDDWDSSWEFNSRGLAQECLRWLK
jgi:hypothetical protein